MPYLPGYATCLKCPGGAHATPRLRITDYPLPRFYLLLVYEAKLKQGLDLDPQNHRDMAHKILLTIFAMLAELERDFVSERTKEGLRSRREQGIVLGKPKGVVQQSMYDADGERILHLHALGVPLATIVDVHLKYGKYLSLKNYLAKLQRQPGRNTSA